MKGDDQWEESEDTWAIGGEEEETIVGTIQQEDNSSWQEASDSWMELDGEGESGVYQRQGENVPMKHHVSPRKRRMRRS